MSKALQSRFIAVGLLGLMFALAVTSADVKSPTMDEQNHIARGAAYLGTGDPRLSVEHPPLVNVLSALPVHLLLRPHLPLDTVWWEAGEWYHFADQFLWEANANAEQIVFLARLPIIGLGMMLAALVFRWAGTRFGPWGGLLAATFCALDPNVLAHVRLSTTDIGGTFFAVSAAYALWRVSRRFSVCRALLAGLALGLAFVAKLSALLFAPILVVVFLLDGMPGGPGRCRRLLGRAGLVGVLILLALLVVWAAYGFQVGRLEEAGPLVPAPPYLRGVQAVLGFAGGGRPGYLLGQVGTEGWWTYFPVAVAVKTPLATLVGLLVATALLFHSSARTRDDLFIVVPPAIFFLASTAARLNLGYRHLLPMLPFLAVHLARLVSLPFACCLVPLSRWLPARRVLAIVLAAWMASASLSIYPHFLAYFNLLGGGPENGWRVLADSNIDWGQDLKGLEAWMMREGVERLRLAWFGSARPEYYGISYDLLPGLPHGFVLWSDPPFDPANPEPGVYAISVSNLAGLVFPDPDLYLWFRSQEPTAKVGYSIFIFEVGAE
jgi:4-amino-4-deoxy-L-arabinose transferase-like glycosyltransferase